MVESRSLFFIHSAFRFVKNRVDNRMDVPYNV